MVERLRCSTSATADQVNINGILGHSGGRWPAVKSVHGAFSRGKFCNGMKGRDT